MINQNLITIISYDISHLKLTFYIYCEKWSPWISNLFAWHEYL